MGGPELLVLRHAKSNWDSDVLSDFDRPLAPRGVRDAPRMGRWLLERDLRPDRVLCSPAERARETAQLVVEAMGVEGAAVVHDERIYEAALPDLFAVLADGAPGASRVLLVGHNPGLEELVRYLARALPPRQGKFFPTAALARLRLESDWDAIAPNRAEILDLVRPKQLA